MAYRSFENPRSLLRSAACCAALAVAGCDDGEEAQPDTTPRAVSIAFEARVGSAPFACGTTYDNLGSSQVSAVFNDFRVYVYDVRLIDKAGNQVPVALDQNGISQLEDAVLLDFEDGTGACNKGTSELNSTITGMVAPGSYTGVAFKVGLPPELNHSDTAASASPLDRQELTWGWNAGRTFVTIDLRTVATDGGAGLAFPVHTGSTLCSGNPAAGQSVSCARKNIAEVELTGFDPEKSKIVVDSAAMVQDVPLDGPGGGCMSTPGDAECESLFANLGIDAATGEPAAGQTVFKVVAK